MEAHLIDEISEIVIVKMSDKKTQSTIKTQSTLMLKLKFVRNSATLDATSSSFETVIYNVRFLDLRSIGYYKVKHGVLQQNLNKYFRFE